MTYDIGTIIGDGIDVAASMLGGWHWDVAGWEAGMTRIAVTAVGAALTLAILEMRPVVRSMGDVGVLVRKATLRAAAFVRHPGLEVWGVVREESTGRPIPLANIHLLDADGTLLLRGISDASGRYGFAAPRTLAAARGARLVATKGGYWPHQAPVHLRAGHHGLVDVALQTRGGESVMGVGRVARFASAGFFWVAMVAAPMSAAASPSILTLGMVALTGFLAVVRGIGLHRAHQ